MSREDGFEPFDLDHVDEWAVRIVVREGAFIRLNTTEKIIVTMALREQGFKVPEIADRLHTDIKEVDAMIRRWQRIGRNACQKRGFNLHQFQLRSAVH